MVCVGLYRRHIAAIATFVLVLLVLCHLTLRDLDSSRVCFDVHVPVVVTGSTSAAVIQGVIAAASRLAAAHKQTNQNCSFDFDSTPALSFIFFTINCDTFLYWVL